MKETITAFLPCRKGSQRIPKKNIKPFAGFNHGLVEIKLKQLIATNNIDKIILSTNDEEILDFSSRLNHPKIITHHRDDALATNNTSTDELISHANSLIDEGHILWTHVTSPFVTSKHYTKIIDCYQKALQDNYDSLMTTTPIQGFLWNDYQPINYDRSVEKWPRTQTINKVHEINSAVFLAHRKIYSELNDRIGKRPYLFELEKLIAQDIDWPDDFDTAEIFAKTAQLDF